MSSNTFITSRPISSVPGVKKVMLLKIYFPLILVAFLRNSAAETHPFYSVSAPEEIRAGTPYRAFVVIHNAPSPVKVNATLVATHENTTLTSSAFEEIKSGEAKFVDITVWNDWKDGTNFHLIVSGSGGIDFEKNFTVSSTKRSYSVFVQTDKAVYKPGDKVNFRVIAVDPLLKPHDQEPVDIFIEDSKGNRIKQWKQANLTDGVFVGEMLLSDEPVLGDWTIRVSYSKDHTKRKSFEVQKYVLPKFDVKVDMPRYLTRNDKDFSFSVTTQYTHGKPVKGQLLLSVSPIQRWGCSNGRSLLLRSPIDGKVSQNIDFVEDLGVTDRSDIKEVKVVATVTEDLTGNKQKGEGSAEVHSSDSKIRIIRSAPRFTPGEPYRFWVSVLKPDGTPVTDTNNVVVVSYSKANEYVPRDNRTYKKDFGLDPSGVITVDIDTPKDTDRVTLFADYKDINDRQDIRVQDKKTSLSGEFIYVAVPGKKYKVEDDLDVIVNSSFPLYDKVSVQVLAHGEVVYGDYVDGNKEKSQTIPIKLTEIMVPIIRIIVYTNYLGEILADKIDIPVEGLFKTKLELDTSINKTEPGNEVTISASTEPEALVALLAVDQSVLLLKKGNDITEKEVKQDISSSYHTGSPYHEATEALPENFVPKYLTNPHPSPNTENLFKTAGVQFGTNGLVQRPPESRPYRPDFRPTSTASFSSPMALSGPPAAFAALDIHEEVALKVAERDEVHIPRRIRSYFPETWLWNMSKAGSEGKAVFTTNAPDTITSWVINAFAIHPEKGLGFNNNPAMVTVTRPFFATLNLPYSIVRGETASIPVLVFNHLPQDQQVVVTVENRHDEFDFVSFDKNGPITQKKRMTRNVEVKSGEGKTVNFFITPKVVGNIDVHVRAGSQFAGDELVRQLLVKPEGIPRYFSNSILVDLRDKTEPFSKNIEFEVPATAVPQSERVEVAAIGDILGTAINNLDQLLRMPYGCGEQNLVNFVPDVVITKYLTETNQITPSIKKKAVQFMESGYQRQLTYKHADGSYSAFGPSDNTGSTWLTAFVLRSFYEAQPYITIDPFVLNQATDWLINRQNSNGSFSEIGFVIDKTLQGGAAKDVALTAYVVTSLLLSGIGEDHPKYGSNVTNALSYLESHLSDIKSDYTLAVVTHAFHLTNNTELKDKAFASLMKAGTVQDGQLFWNNTRTDDKRSESSSNEANAASIEATAYALMSYVLRNQITEAIPIVRWLISQQNEFGGFASTQDTVVGIQALALFANKTVMPPGSNVKVDITDQSGTKASFDVNRDNSLVLQKEVLNRKTRSVKVDATGNGVAIVQVAWSYHVNATKQGQAFSIQPTAVLKNTRYLHVNICTSYTGENKSNMALMEIAFPTGFYADEDNLPEQSDLTKVKRVETKYGSTVIAVYFDYVSSRTVCIPVNAIRATKVARLKPAAITIFDYYDPVKRGEVLYEVPGRDSSSLCELCDEQDKDCSSQCNSVLKEEE